MCETKLAMQGEPTVDFPGDYANEGNYNSFRMSLHVSIRHTCSAMFKLNKTLNDYVV